MGRHSFLEGLATFTVAAVTAAGICYLFKDEIKGTKTYQDLNDKYDVDSKINLAADKAKNAASKAKDTAFELKDKAFVVKDDLMDKYNQMKGSEENLFDDDEIILDESDVEERDYVRVDNEDDDSDPIPSTDEKSDVDNIVLD